MSLLGLLEEMPDLDTGYPIPDFPSSLLDAGPPLSQFETDRWNDIVRNLGNLMLDDDEDPPIWRELSAKYASLMLGPSLARGEIWGSEDWIASDFEDTWSRATPVWNETVSRQQDYLDAENAPPRGFRMPAQMRRDTTGMDDATMERVLEGLRRL